MKKFLTYSVVAATMAWSMGIASVLPAAAAYSPVDGDVVKVASQSRPAVYYIMGGKKFLFVNRVTYSTWSSAIGDTSDKFATIKAISQAEFDAIDLGGNVTARAGAGLVKFDNSDLVYAVAPGAKLCKLADAATKTALYGAAAVATIQSSFEANYTKDASCALTATSKYPDGTLIKSGTSYFYVEGGMKKAVDSSAFSANGFKDSWAVTLADTSAYTSGSAISGKFVSVVAGATATPSAAGLTVSIASGSPASGTLVAGQSTADLAHFMITNTGSSDVKITKVVLARAGISADATLSNVYLFKGSSRLTDSASVSTGNITFTEFTSGIVTVPANGSVTLSVKSDIASGTAGQTVGVRMVSINDSSFVGTGNLMSIASATDLATVALGASTTVASTMDPASDVVVWGNNTTVNGRDVTLSRLALREVGSINSSDIGNFRLYVDGILIATTASLDANGYVTFVPTSPVTLKVGNRVLKVLADVTGGANRTFQFSLKGAYDIDVTDSSYGVNVTASYVSTYGACGTVTVNSVSTSGVTVQRSSDTPSGNVVKGSSAALLASYDLTTYGEAVKLDTLTFKVTNSNTATFGSLRNGYVTLNGNQVGSIATLATTTAGTAFNVNATLAAGTKNVVKVYADIYDNDGTDNTADAQTLTVTMIAGSNNGQGKTSGSLVNVPATAATSLATTVKAGSMSLSKVSAYGAQTVVLPQTSYKIASYVLNGNASESVNLNTITLDFTASSLTVTKLSGVYLKYNGKTSTVKSSVASTSNAWSINESLAVNGSMNIEVYADIASGLSGNIIATTTVDGTTNVSGASTSTAAAGQTISTGNGYMTVTTPGNPTQALVSAGNTVDVANFKFTAINDNYSVKSVTVSTTDATTALGIDTVYIKDGNNVIGTVAWGGISQTITFANPVAVTAGGSNAKTLTVAVKTAGVNLTNTNKNIKMGLASYETAPSSGSSYSTTTGATGANIYVFRSKPASIVVSNASNLKLRAGSQVELAKVTVTADAANDISLKSLVFTLTTSTAAALATNSVKLYDTDNVTILAGTAWNSTVSTYATTTLTTEQTIGKGASKTYTLKADISGTIASTDSLGISIAARDTTTGTSTASTVQWSDLSDDSTHSLNSVDWYSDFLLSITGSGNLYGTP